MTDKEKAIKALDDIRLVFKKEFNYPLNLTTEYKTLISYLTQPTLDDCIAVVEDFKKSFDYTATTTVKQGFYHEDNIIRETLERLLTALKGHERNKRMLEKIKELQKLCEYYHLDLRVQYYSDHEVCFKGINDNEKEVFNVAVWYPPKQNEKRRFYIELNSEYEEWAGGQFTKETILLLLSIDDLRDEELNIKQQEAQRA